MERNDLDPGNAPASACESTCLSRRGLLAGAGALSLAAVTGCSSYGNESSTPASAPPAGSPLAKTSDIPVGSGKIFEDAKLVVTQPTAGTFKAFSGVCTHQGCLVSSIESDTISCNCHGSQFTLEGEVSQGPAEDPLPAQNITVSGEDIILT